MFDEELSRAEAAANKLEAAFRSISCGCGLSAAILDGKRGKYIGAVPSCILV